MFKDFDWPKHRPVLYQEVIHALRPEKKGRYVDCTVGAGGHAFGLLEASAPDGMLLGLDVDSNALELARRRLSQFEGRVILKKASYTRITEELHNIQWQSVNGILFDLGVSSMQLETPDRGFSFLSDAPLDMRFDHDNPYTAADLINNWSAEELTDIFQRYGEERYARQIAKEIIRQRPLLTTQELAELVARVVRRGQAGLKSRKSPTWRIHPATRIFQALRIAVNKELQALEQALPQAMACLFSGGILAVISFHSLEDRIVKNYFQIESQDCICPPSQPVCTCGHHARLQKITRRPIRPKLEEIETNPRARSALLRVAMKI